jgi:peptide deformylase
MLEFQVLKTDPPAPERGYEAPTPALQALLQDMRDTMAAASGTGLAAPQIGEDVQVVIFGSGQVNPRYPDAPPVPPTVLINPIITPVFEPNQPLALINPAQSAHDLIAFGK